VDVFLHFSASPFLSRIVLSSIYRLVDGFVSIIVENKKEKKDCYPVFNDHLKSFYRNRASSWRSSNVDRQNYEGTVFFSPYLYPFDEILESLDRVREFYDVCNSNLCIFIKKDRPFHKSLGSYVLNFDFNHINIWIFESSWHIKQTIKFRIVNNKIEFLRIVKFPSFRILNLSLKILDFSNLQILKYKL